MPKIAKELKPMVVSKIKKEGLHAVGIVPGLYLRIEGNSRSWVLRAHIGGKERKMGLGSYPEVSLDNARDKARELRKQIRDGLNPIEERKAQKARLALKAAKAKTFAECAAEYITAHRTGWKDKTASRWDSTLPNYVFPKIGKLSIADIDTGLVLEILQQPIETPDGIKTLWEAKTVTATRIRGQLESVFDWAKVRGLREGDNPAAWQGHLEYQLPSKGKIHKEEHHPALPYTEIGAFMAELRKNADIAARVLEFAILTAVRSQEVRKATWEEIDVNARLWTIPADRMKKGTEHRIPLSYAAIEILKSLPRCEETNVVFLSPKGGAICGNTLLNLLQRMHKSKLAIDGKGWIDPKQNYRRVTVHGFRSTFDDWASETTTHKDKAIDFALAHKLRDKVREAYLRGNLLDDRKHLMEDWARYCDTIPAAKENNVVSIRKAV